MIKNTFFRLLINTKINKYLKTHGHVININSNKAIYTIPRKKTTSQIKSKATIFISLCTTNEQL